MRISDWSSDVCSSDLMMDQAAQRIDQLYTQALNDGRLRPDPSLIIEEPVDPDALAIENAADLPVEMLDAPTPAAATGSFAIQFDTPDVGSVAPGEAALRSIPGARSPAPSSLALAEIRRASGRRRACRDLESPGG